MKKTIVTVFLLTVLLANAGYSRQMNDKMTNTCLKCLDELFETRSKKNMPAEELGWIFVYFQLTHDAIEKKDEKLLIGLLRRLEKLCPKSMEVFK
ncbi:MAG: hypothetical protein GY756_06095 [bacterium]|nr:hypothetical protein [bacterium]